MDVGIYKAEISKF